jgi:hypothetical protein
MKGMSASREALETVGKRKTAMGEALGVKARRKAMFVVLIGLCDRADPHQCRNFHVSRIPET